MRPYRFTVFATALILFACTDSPTVPDADVVDGTLAIQSLVEICHYDAETDAYVPIRVSDNGSAIDAHFAHGDGYPGDPVPGQEGFGFEASCGVVELEPEEDGLVFALAYSDVDGSPGYDPSVDVLIAKLVDDGNGVLGPGDRVVVGMVPTDPAASGFDPFGIEEHVIARVDRATSEEITVVYSPDGDTFFIFEWQDRPGVERWWEYRRTVNIGPATTVQDVALPGGVGDFTATNTLSPSEPPTTEFVFDDTAGEVDNDFLEVLINLSGGL